MIFTFRNRVPLKRSGVGASVVCFPMQAVLLKGFPIHQINLPYYRWCLVPRTSSLCSYILSSRGSWNVCCLHLKIHSQLINSFNKTGAAVFSCGLCFLWTFLFISLIYTNILRHVCVKIYLHFEDNICNL